MQAPLHSMAHRGSGIPRSNTRWHPYTPPRVPGSSSSPYAMLAPSSSTPHQSLCSNQQLLSQDLTYLITPASSVLSTSTSPSSQSPAYPLSAASSNSACASAASFHLRARPSVVVPKATATPKGPNYVAQLIDTAVKSLTDIWRPENIPPVFASSVQASSSSTHVCHQAFRPPNVYLLSPCSPSTKHTSFPSSAAEMRDPIFQAERSGGASNVSSEKDLVPMTTFVNEVLRRSRTTCSVLQSALCYIEAIRAKVPELVEKEIQGLGVRGEPELADRVILADEAELAQTASEGDNNSNSNQSTALFRDLHAELLKLGLASGSTSGQSTVVQSDALMTIASDGTASSSSSATLVPSTMTTCQASSNGQSQEGCRKRKIPPKPLTPLPPLPSPLLCPRRTFLAALILASKFLQDRCYSNRAWAKLSGLPPREVGRCERALGEALEWRLWVGKDSNMGTQAGDAERISGLSRAKSESVLRMSPSSSASISPIRTTCTFLSPPLSDAGQSPELTRSGPVRGVHRSLRRAATLPDEAAMRSVPPRYRTVGSLPFSFASTVPPPRPVVPVSQAPALLPLPLPASADSFFGVSAASMSMFATPQPMSGLFEEATPRCLDSPLSGVFTTTAGAATMWSPTPSNGSSGSSDSGGSVATPPDNAPLSSLARSAVGAGAGTIPLGDILSLVNGKEASRDAAMWYEQVMSALGANLNSNSNSNSNLGVPPVPIVGANALCANDVQMSMLDACAPFVGVAAAAADQ